MNKRHILNGVSALIIAVVGLAALLAYDSGDVSISGATADAKFQAVATTVTKQSAGAVYVLYLKPEGSATSVAFIFGAAKSGEEFTSQEDAIARQQALQKAIATTLRLVATKVLPTEPSIKNVSVIIIVDGQLVEYVASAQELKVLPADAEDRSWLSKLQEP